MEPEAGKAADPRTPKPRRAATVKAVLPPSWAPSPAHYDQARTEGAKGREWVDAESRAMRDWAASKGERSADWDARFRNWIRRGLQGGTTLPLRQPAAKVQPARPGHSWKPMLIEDILGEKACPTTPKTSAL